MRLKDINKSATLAWSPQGVNNNQPLLAVGGYIGTESTRESDNLLEIWDTSAEFNQPICSANVNTKFYDLDWEKSLDKQHGVIAGTLEEGGVGFYDASAILGSNESSASIATYKPENNSILGPLDFNPVQTNLLASGDNNGDVWVWDLKNPLKPFSLPKQNRSSEIHVVAWNSKVSHILASGNSSEYTTVWDLKAKRQILNLSYMGATGTNATGGVNSIAWHPENATRLVTAIDDNRNPIILTWDLRYPTAPQNVLTGHQKAALSLSWCPHDSRFLLSSGKDGRAIVWDVDTGESLGNFPRSGNWYTKGSWCPSNSNRVATSSLDGKVSIFSIQSTNTDKTHEASLQGVTSIDDNEFFNNLPSIAGSQEPAFTLPIAPKWYKVPCGVRFGFPNKLIRFNPESKGVIIEPLEPEQNEESIEKFSSTTKFQTEDDIVSFCESGAKSAKSDEEANNWKLLKAVSQRVSRSEFVKLLGRENIKELHKEESTAELDKSTKASINVNDTSKNQNNESYDDDTSFYGKLSDNLQNTVISDKEVEFSNDPFKIFNSEDSELETTITKMLLTGDILSAIKTCIDDKKISEALFLATFGDEECRKCVRKAFYEMQEHKPSYMRLSACIADDDLENAVQNADLSQWKDIFVFICTYAANEAFSPLCGILGKRLEDLDDFSSNRAAEFCYIASKSLQSYANLWLKELAKGDVREDTKSSYVEYVDQLTKLMDKVNAFRSIVAYEDDELSATGEWKLSGLYEVYLEYSRILLSAGHYEQARSYLNLVPASFPGAKQEIERLSILLTPAPIPEVNRSAYGPSRSVPHPAPSFIPQPVQAATNPSNPYASAYSSNVSQATAAPPMSSTIPPPAVSNNVTAGWNDAPIVQQPPLRRAAPSLPAVRSPFPNTGAPLAPNMSRTSSTSTLPPPPPSVGNAAAAPPPPKIGETYQPQVQNVNQPSVNQVQKPANPYTPIGVQSPARTLSGLSSPAETKGSSPYVPVGGPGRPPLFSPPVQPTAPFNAAVPPPKASANRVVPVPPTPSQRISSYEPVNTGFAQSPPMTMPPVNAQIPPPVSSAVGGSVPPPPVASSSVVSPPPQSLPSKRQSASGPSAVTTGMTTYPQGDRSHIPPNLKPIYEMLNAEFLRVSQSVPPQMSRVLHDMEKRLNMLYDRLNANALSKPLTDELYALAVALMNRDYQSASNIQVTLVTTLQDQCEHWIVGITRLITISKSTA